jgi:hypothetical protein
MCLDADERVNFDYYLSFKSKNDLFKINPK